MLAPFAERNITFVADRETSSTDTARRVATFDDGRDYPYALFLEASLSRRAGKARCARGARLNVPTDLSSGVEFCSLWP